MRTKRFLSLLLCVCMALAMLPGVTNTAHAAGSDLLVETTKVLKIIHAWDRCILPPHHICRTDRWLFAQLH